MYKNYVIALYCRLSRADAEFGQVADESESIKNQIDQLMKYVKNMKEYSDADIIVFSDDGYTGRHFNRPDFMKLRNMIIGKKIDCVIVKDFSRFGRDYIELGDYVEQLFPLYGVRFISVNDGYDSKFRIESNMVDIGFVNLLYSYYSKDLSRKVKNSVQQRKREGRFTCGPVRFGFLKKPGSKVELKIDEKAAEIIRSIFSMAEQGMRTKDIAVRLNEKHVLTPAMYSYAYNQKCKWTTAGKEKNSWTQSGVVKILRDERYIGTYVEYVDGEKGKECIRIPGKYPAIVNSKTFYQAQKVMSDRKRPQGRKGSDNVFKGIIKCGNCNHALALSRGKRNRYYYCKNSKFNVEQGCTVDCIAEEELKQCVLKVIQDYVRMMDLAGEDNFKKHNQEYIRVDKRYKVKLEKEREVLEGAFFLLYEEYQAGEVTREIFQVKKMALEARKQKVEEDLYALEKQGGKTVEMKTEVLQREIIELTEEAVKRFIRVIAVDSGGQIEIRWKIKNPFAK